MSDKTRFSKTQSESVNAQSVSTVVAWDAINQNMGVWVMSIFRWLTLATAGVSLALSACTEQKPVPPPDVNINPAPIEKYEITIHIDPTISPPLGVGGKVSYRVHNPKHCMPLDQTRALGGVRPDPYRERPLVYEKISDYVYRTYVYEDYILNEDYYSLGICDWGIEVATAGIAIGSSTQEDGIVGDEIKRGTPHIAFCPNNNERDLMVGDGCTSTRYEKFSDEMKKNFYRVQIISRRMTP